MSLCRKNISLRISRDAVHGIELSRLAATIAKACQYFERVPKHDIHFVVRPVGNIKVLLLGIRRKRNVKYRTFTEGVLRDKYLFYESAIWFEHLDPIVNPITDIEQSVMGEFGTVHRISKLLRRRCRGIILAEVGIVRLVAVGSPVAFVLTGLCVKDDDASIAIAIGYISFIRLRINKNLGW